MGRVVASEGYLRGGLREKLAGRPPDPILWVVLIFGHGRVCKNVCLEKHRRFGFDFCLNLVE